MPDKEDNISQKTLGISWWKLAIGLILAFIEVKSWLMPERNFPEALRASNETQEAAIYLVSCAIFLIGLGFVVAGLRGLWRKNS